MINKKFSSIILLLLVLYAYDSSASNDAGELKKYLISIGDDGILSKDAYFIVAADVALSCIETYRSYIDSVNNENVQFIIIGKGLKKIQLTFGKDVIRKKNVLVDKDGVFYRTPLYKDIAQIFYCRDDELIDVKEITVAALNKELYALSGFLNNRKIEQREKELVEKINQLEKSSFFSHLYGKQAPKFQGTMLNGKIFNLDDHIGKIVVVNFWFIQCPYCYAEVPDLNRISLDSQNENFVFVSVCASSLNEINATMEKVEKNGMKRIRSTINKQTMYYDIIPEGKEIAMAYGVTMFPITIVIDKKGTVSNAVPYTTFFNYPDELITYRIIKEEIRKCNSL